MNSRHYVYVFLIVSQLTMPGCASQYVSQHIGIADSQLPELAITRKVRGGAIVIYNPDMCEQIGEACGFFRMHAYAHIFLEHQILPEPGDYTPSIEKKADCWAASHIKESEVRAAVEFLLDEDRHAGLRIHGNPAERA